MESQSLDIPYCSDEAYNTGPCSCCPYGFHIDTDFVRYCDALLNALNSNNKSPSYFRGSPRREFHFDMDSYHTYHSVDKSFMHLDFYLKHHHTHPQLIDDLFIENNFSFKQATPHNNKCFKLKSLGQHFHSYNSMESDLSVPNNDVDLLSEAVNKFEQVYLEANNLQSTRNNGKNQSTKCENYFSSMSSTPSFISSTIPKTVLTQIRSHLALSLSRVKELENQVSQIPRLKDEIKKLQSERSTLVQKLNWQDNNDYDLEKCSQATVREVKSINIDLAYQSNEIKSFLLTGSDSVSTKEIANHSTSTNQPCHGLSLFKSETTIINDSSVSKGKDTRSIGTLTSFAPCKLHRNVIVQTDLTSKDFKTANTVSTGTETDHITQKSISCQTLESVNSMADCNNSQENGSQTENFILKDAQVQVTNNSMQLSKARNDKAVSTSDLFSIESDQMRNSFDLINNSTPQSMLTPNSALSNSISPPSSSSSTQSMRLCDKCHQMVAPDDCDGLNTQVIKTISLPKIIKSDSGISVERRQVDNKVIDDSNNSIHVCHASELEMSISENTQLSDDSDYSLKYYNKGGRKSFDHQQISNETKVALKIINEHLLESKKSNFLHSKSVAYIKKLWFKISSSVDSESRVVEYYLDCFEKFSTKLLCFVVNLIDTNGNTAMHYAISYNNFHIVSVLLDSKVCDVNRFNKAGYTSTMLVSLAKIENDIYRDVVERLFNQADLNIKAKQNGQTALMLAASHGRLEISKILLECGAEVNLRDNDGSTALMCAAEHGHSKVIALLLAHPDCDPLIEDNEGSTALKIALVNGHNDIGILLYAGTRTSSCISTSLYSSLNQLSNSWLYSGHLRRTGSFSPAYSQSPHNMSLPLTLNSQNRIFLSAPNSPN